MPKLEFNYFTERISKNSNNRVCKEQMVKLRKVYTGEEPLFFELVTDASMQPKQPEVVFSYAQADAQIASKKREQELSKQKEDFHFRMHEEQDDAEQIIDTTSRPKPDFQLTDKQLHLIEENKRKALERRRQAE